MNFRTKKLFCLILISLVKIPAWSSQIQLRIETNAPWAQSEGVLVLEYSASKEVKLVCQTYDYFQHKWAFKREFKEISIPLNNRVSSQIFNLTLPPSPYGFCNYQLSFFYIKLPASMQNYEDLVKKNLMPDTGVEIAYHHNLNANTSADSQCLVRKIDTQYRYMYDCVSQVSELNLYNSNLIVHLNIDHQVAQNFR